MRIQSAMVFALVSVTVSASALAGHDKHRKAVSEFENAEIRIEQNATDGDTEVVIFVKGGDDGFKHLSVRAPDRRMVVSTFSLDPTIRGQRELLFESPEPPGEAILASYPEGTYVFKGVTHAGERFVGRAHLSHDLPLAALILAPSDGACVPPGPLVIEWSAVTNAEQIILELENESADPEQSFTFSLPADATRFELPATLIAPGASYQLGIGTVGENGNIVFVEVGFETE
jgi:hypothetical protein